MQKHGAPSPARLDDKNIKSKNNKDTETLPLKKSTRDWSTPPSTGLDNLSLISRSQDSPNQQSLKSVQLQIELWNDICQKTNQVKDPSDRKQWVPLVDLLRKLREGVWASHWSQGNIRFAVKVYEESVHTSLRCHAFEEYRKAIRALVDELYYLDKKGINGHYLALDAIYQACHLEQPQEAMNTIYQTEIATTPYYNGHEIKYAKQIIHALSTNHWIHFFRLYQHPPHPAFVVLLAPSVDTVRRRALLVMQKVYYTAPLSWIASALALPSSDLVDVLHDLHTPSLVDRIENDTLYFRKKFK